MGTKLPYDPAIPLLDIYPKGQKPNYQTNPHIISMLIAAKFTNAKLQNQPRCPSQMNGSQNYGKCTQWNFTQP